MEEIEYPCLMIFENTVVCFSSYNTGHVVDSNTYDVGYFSTDWVMDAFKPYEPLKEPVYEYLCIYSYISDGTSYMSSKFFTEEEAKCMYGDRFVEMAEWSKRERK